MSDTARPDRKRVEKSAEQWRKELDDNTFHVTREAGTEPAFTGRYWDEKAAGTYACSNCGTALFRSETKYESGTGWPSFYRPVEDGVVAERRDVSHGMVRTEALCAVCDAHLGHVFPDGPAPTGLRYCMNSASLELEKDDE